jgi:hypothetical protein
MADLQDFHYMSVLRQLELEAGKLAGPSPQSTDRKLVGRLMDVFAQAKQKLKLAGVADGAKISLNLKFSRDKQLATEKAIAENLRKLTEGRAPTDETQAIGGEWPPVIPAHRMVERFTALAIGLHAENPRRSFGEHAQDAFRSAVIPALAWGLMAKLYQLPPETRALAQTKLADRLAEAGKPTNTEVGLGGDAYRRIDFRVLRLIEAWYQVFEAKSPCHLSPESIQGFREDLAARFRKPLGDLDTQLWQELGELYVQCPAGSERARAVALASGNAAFLRSRLVLFRAATGDGMQDFRLRTEQRLDEAVKQTFACEKADPSDREAAGLEACGAAFWLARASFAKHGPQHEDAAAARALILLLRAGVMLRHQPDWVTTCVRYAAGFATNPRYARSRLVMDFQRKLVLLYAQRPNVRHALLEQFKGRLAWQQWQAGDKSAERRALAHYMKALELHDQGSDGLDSEGPVHFFPELIVLLGQTADGRRAEADLRTVDYITQRNYGIYFDIEKETSAIEGGLEGYADYVKSVMKDRGKLDQARRARAEAAEAAELAALESGREPAQVDGGSNWEDLSPSADHKLCAELIAELRRT